jgi:ubiquitin-protein ligase
MATDSEQSTSEYEQLKETLELYPSIKIIHVEGQPPDNYEIEYHLKGYVRNPDGSIAPAELHRIQITLPFGYPHFPPTVKPLTHLFHPDIDPAAIRIAEQWKAKPNLSDLVLTVGEMICGNIYSTEDAFNQEAADWYGQHSDELPLDVLQIADIDDSDERFDTLDEDTFSSLGLDDDDLFGTESEADDSQIDLVRLQIEQKNFFAASQTLSEIPRSANISDREELEQSIAGALKESDKLYKKVEQLENSGQLDEAAKVIEEIEAVAADTPGLDALRNRILQSLSLADSFSTEPKEEPEENLAAHEEADTEKSSPPPIQKSKKPNVSVGSSIPLKLIFSVGILCILLLVGGMLYLKDKKILDQSHSDWEKACALTKNRQFDDAQAEGESILRNLKNLNLLKSSQKALSEKITTLLNSDDFQQGLLGNTLYEGVYVPFAKAEKLKELLRLREKAEDLVKHGKIRKSLAAYQEALTYARKHELVAQAKNLTQTINNLRFEDALATAKKAEDEKEWENAAETYRRALELSRNLSDPKEAAEITKRLTTATFRHELDQSRQSFTGAQWQETITMLENAQALINENPTTVSPKERSEVNQLLFNSRLYQMLTLAREAYEIRDWENSIKYYRDALNLLDTEKGIFGEDVGESYAKIEKTLLMMQLAQEQSKAMAAKKKESLNEVVGHYNKILTLIRTSAFQNDENLRTLTGDIQSQRAEIQEQLDLRDKINYLKDNYQEIFKKNYPFFAGSNLQHPKVHFNKKIGRKMLFTMTCVERSQGSASRLELKYLYNPDTNHWTLYTN